MSEEHRQETRTEAVGIFQDADSLQAAIDDLLTAGFDRAELSLLADEAAVERKLGHAYARSTALEDAADAPRIAYISAETRGDAEGGLIGALVYVGAVAAAGAVVATGGSLAAIIAAAAVAGGAGGAIGGVLAALVGERHARHLQEHLDHGGLLLWVRTRDPAHEQRAKEILSRHSAQDVHLHAIPV